MKRNNFCAALLSLILVPSAWGDSYDALLKRYERQIKKQEKHLQTLKANLQEKERETLKWQQRAEESKSQWAQAASSVRQARENVEASHQELTKTQRLAEAAEWSVAERTLLRDTASHQAAALTSLYFKSRRTATLMSPNIPLDAQQARLLTAMSDLTHQAGNEATAAQKQEVALRTQELHWRSEQQKRTEELEAKRQQQQSHWARWQEALRRKNALEEERNQLEQSEQALRVVLKELRDHRNHTASMRQERGGTFSRALSALKGTLPWPLAGRVTQNFGRQYSTDLQQLLVSNGIKIEGAAGRAVRAVQEGKVLFASPFRQYGQLVILQHKSGLTSVYGGLGQTLVKEGQLLAALEPVGQLGDSGSFYFELRHHEEPINPMVFLTPIQRSDVSSRRTYQ